MGFDSVTRLKSCVSLSNWSSMLKEAGGLTSSVGSAD